MNRTRFFITALTAALTLMALVGSASANRLSVSNQNLRIVWSERPEEGLQRLRWYDPANANNNVRCNITLEGSFHSRTITKTPELLIGYVTRAELGNCAFAGIITGVRFLTETLPWHIRYCGFTGSLPTNISVRLCLINYSISQTALGFIVCLYKSTPANPMVGDTSATASGGLVGSIRANAERTNIPKFSGISECPASATFEGTGLIRLLGTTDVLVSLWLI